MRLPAALLSIIAVAVCFGVYSEAQSAPGKSVAAAQQPAVGINVSLQADPREPDNSYGPSFAYIAWTLFLQAMAPANGSLERTGRSVAAVRAEDLLTFETWTEQCQLSSDMVGCPSAGSVMAAAKTAGDRKLRTLHGSVFSPAKRIGGDECSAMTTTPIGGYPAPSNLTPNAAFCEEVFVSPAEAAFVKRNLTTLVAQQAYGSPRNQTINFPGTGTNDSRLDLDSLEVKVDWVPAASFKNPTFACPDSTNSLYTETINGTCYALAAIHISSKVMPNWLWATFEPNSNITNPNRCDSKLYGACLDIWGTTSGKPYGKGQAAQQSPELRQAMAEAHLNPAFNNYFLTGVQTQFVDTQGKAIQLGNSFIEFNQGVAPGRSSCITCHKYASFDGRQPVHGAPENDFGRPLLGWPSVGYACNQNQNDNCTPAVPNATTQDFSWMLGLMPYSDAGAKAPADKSQPAAKN